MINFTEQLLQEYEKWMQLAQWSIELLCITAIVVILLEMLLLWSWIRIWRR